MPERTADELPRGLLGIDRLGKDVGDLLIGDLVREAVAAEEIAAPHLCVQIPDVEHDFSLDAERPSEHVPMRMDGGFLRRQLALADHLLHDGVIFGQLT